MDLSSEMLETSSDAHQKHAIRIVGRNQLGDEDPVWVLSEEIQISCGGSVTVGNESPFLWLRRIVNGSNVLVQESLQCMISTPFDAGESLNNLCLAVRRFMPENFTAAMATISAVVMGANYVSILKMFGCCGVPVLTGPPESCKLEASNVAYRCLVLTNHILAIVKRHHHISSRQQARLRSLSVWTM